MLEGLISQCTTADRQVWELAELLADFERDGSGADGIDGVFGVEHFAEIAAFHVLHRDKEIAVQVASFVDLHHARIEPIQLTLDLCPLAVPPPSPAASVCRYSRRNQLQDGFAMLDGIDGQIHVGHAVSDLPHDLVASNAR